jgi:hypothetical protein
MIDKDKLTKAKLNQFTGSDSWYRHPLVRTILYTEGADYLAEHAGAYWLLDEIAFAQHGEKTVAAQEFQVWTLTVDPARRSGRLACADGNDRIVFEKVIDYTDFPLPEISLWFTNNTIYLPSEH